MEILEAYEDRVYEEDVVVLAAFLGGVFLRLGVGAGIVRNSASTSS